MTKSHEGPYPRMLFPYQTPVPHLGVTPASLGTECPIVVGISDISMLKASPKIRRLLCNTQETFPALGTLQSSETVSMRKNISPFTQQADDQGRDRTQSILSKDPVIQQAFTICSHVRSSFMD